MAKSGISVKFQRGINGVQAFKSGGPKDIAIQQAMKKAAEDELARIKIRTTQQHVDFEGKPFKPYSPGYEKRKKRLGRSGRVDLTLTGEMLSALTLTIKSAGSVTTAIFGFTNAGAALKSKWNETLGRKFLALTNDAVERVKAKVRLALRLK